jgi:hypothetical protein
MCFFLLNYLILQFFASCIVVNIPHLFPVLLLEACKFYLYFQKKSFGFIVLLYIFSISLLLALLFFCGAGAVPDIGLSTSYLLGRYFTTWTTIPVLFPLVYFLNRLYHFLHGTASDCYPPTFASSIVGITAVYHHAWLVLLRWGLLLFTRTGLSYNPLNLHLPST